MEEPCKAVGFRLSFYPSCSIFGKWHPISPQTPPPTWGSLLCQQMPVTDSSVILQCPSLPLAVT